MTLHLSLPPEIEARLRERAAATGKDVETFVLEAVEEMLAAPVLGSQPSVALLGNRDQLEGELLGRADETESVVMDADDVRRMSDTVRRRVEQRGDR